MEKDPNDMDIGDLDYYRDMIENGSIEDQYIATNWFRRVLSIETDPPIDEVLQSDVVRIFIVFLQKDDNLEIQFEAAWALTNICSGQSEHVKYVVDNGAVPYLVRLLASSHEDIREQACWALGNIAADSIICRDIVILAGAVPALVALCEGFEDAEARQSFVRVVMWAISNMCKDKPAPALSTTSILLPALAQHVDTTDIASVADACWALSYISDGAEDSEER